MKDDCKESLFYKIIRPLVKIFFLLYNPKIKGKENIPKEGRIVLAGNHTHLFDCLFLIVSTKRAVHFLAKDDLFKGWRGPIFSNLGLIPVNRRQKDPKALESAINYLNHDKVIGIFPEGTLGRGKLLPFKIGAVKMAYETNSKIVPFAITGDYKLFSKNLKIVFSKPIKITNSNLEEENKRLRDKVESLINGE